MAWNTNDWSTEEEDRHWEMNEEDTDDEFDDQMLARLGVELPACAKEPPRQYNTNTYAEIQMRGESSGIGISMNEWAGVIAALDLTPEIREQFTSIIGNDGNIRFGEPQGIDPQVAGLDEEYDWTDCECD